MGRNTRTARGDGADVDLPRLEGGDHAFAALRAAELFSAVADDELQRIADRATVRDHAKGDVLWRAGDPGDEFLIVASGELAVWGRAGDGSDVVINLLSAGEPLGELALLLDEPRAATVTCVRAARVVAIGKVDFQEFVRDDARVLALVTRELSQRLAARATERPVLPGTTVIGVVAERRVPGASLVASALVASLARVTRRRVLHLRLTTGGAPGRTPDLEGLRARVVDEQHAPALDLAFPAPAGRADLSDAVHEVVVQLGHDHPFIVVDYPARAIATTPPLVEACDVVVTVTDRPSRLPGATAGDGGSLSTTRVFEVVNQYARDAVRVPVTRVDPFVVPNEPGLATLGHADQLAWLAANPRSGFARTVDRLARKIVGATIGLALGGGAAFGIAHVGVILAFERLGVPIDLVCGTSMGSIVALGYASGLSGEEMWDFAHQLGNVPTTLRALDPSLSGSGILAGRRLVNTFGPLMPAQRFEELVVPCTTVATDIESGERVVIASGRLDHAFRASASVPVLWAPVRHDGRTLVDGAMVDPVPTDVVREMGADLVCAVNVVPRPRAGVSTAITRLFKRATRLNPFNYLRGTGDLPDMIDVLMNSLQTVQCELGDVKSATADVLVNVDLAEFTWIEFYRAAEIVERGLAAGEDAAARMHAALRTRLERATRTPETVAAGS